MAILPSQGKLELPIQWSVELKKITQEVGSYQIQTTLGINPEIATVSMTWRLPANQIKAHLDIFRADKWVGLYTYTCPIMGDVVLRPTSNFSFTEDVAPTGLWQVTVDFRRVS